MLLWYGCICLVDTHPPGPCFLLRYGLTAWGLAQQQGTNLTKSSAQVGQGCACLTDRTCPGRVAACLNLPQRASCDPLASMHHHYPCLQALINSFLDSFPGVRSYLEQVKAAARQEGCVRTLAGRTRPIKGLTASDNR